ncbi:MAG: Ppx/GppA family phosphatase, partial [Herpetosiphon sp.]|nr:Ppx/GppA family phosphatase [Herpetosiphon sp.]
TMFDQLHALHGYGAWERELLASAAILHDIGVSINYYDHHKHSLYLILNAGLNGFNHRELVLIGLLTRFHRKGNVIDEGLGALLQSDDLDRVAKLAALLRIAEYLERAKSQVIQTVSCRIEKQRVIIEATSVGDATVEIWDANRRTSLFRKAYGMEIEIVELGS